MNYISQIQKTLGDFRASAQKAEREIEEARNKYKPDIAEEEVKRISIDLRNKKAAALEAVRTSVNAGAAAAEAWGHIDGSKMTDDAKLLQFGVSEDDFKQLVNRYQGNATMSKLLYNYGTEKKYNTSDIDTVEKRAKKYDSIGKTAEEYINRLTSNDYWVAGANNTWLNNSIDDFIGRKDF